MTEDVISIDLSTVNNCFIKQEPKKEKFRILKYPIRLMGEILEIEVPFRHEVVLFAEQQGEMFVWIAVGLDKDQRVIKHGFKVVGTGHEFEGPVWGIRSIVCGPYVWHLIDLGWENK